jgi:hypothetical protein
LSVAVSVHKICLKLIRILFIMEKYICLSLKWQEFPVIGMIMGFETQISEQDKRFELFLANPVKAASKLLDNLIDVLFVMHLYYILNVS